MKSANGLTLLIPDKADAERNSVAATWEKNGGTVLRLGRFWDPPHFDSTAVRVYGNDSFAHVLAQKLGLNLVSPEDDLILKIKEPYLKRQIRACLLSETDSIDYPTFLKPLVPKLFRAAVYQSLEQLEEEVKGLSPTTQVIISEIVGIVAEARFFVLDKEILDGSFYEGSGNLAEAQEFVRQVLDSIEVPASMVVDVGYIKGRGWALVEFNAAWGAGLNGCASEKVWPAISAASETME